MITKYHIYSSKIYDIWFIQKTDYKKKHKQTQFQK